MRRQSVSAHTITASLAIASFALISACGPDGEREPRLRQDPTWRPPEVVERAGVRYVENAAAEAQLDVQQADAAVEATQLVFWGDQAVARDATGYHFAANTENHEVLMFDDEHGFIGALLPQGPDGDRLQRPLLIAAGSGERLAAFEAAGTVLLFDRWGREFVRLETPFAYAVGAWGPDGRLTLARSPFNVAFNFEGADPPLLVTLDPARPDGAKVLGRAHEALSPFYIHATNAGTVTLDDQGNIYFAALARAEVEKLDPYGETVWVSRRPAGFDTPEPRLVQNPDGPARLRLSTVQKASAIGPDGLLYVRAAADAAMEYDRLDALDPETGAWLRSAPLDTGTAVLVGSRGAVWQLPRTALLVDRTRKRRAFPSFALKTFDGHSVELEDLRGKVALVSFWASWCAPCREELPLLDSLNAAIQRPDFVLIGIAEDVNEEDARAFADEIGLEMTSLLGHGRMRQRYHYSGLPYSVLLDRESRIIKEYYGFGGRQAFDREVAGRVLAALGEPAGVTEPVTAPPANQIEHSHEHGGEVQPTAHRHGSEDRHGSEGGLPAIAHQHRSPPQAVSGREIAELVAHLENVRGLDISTADLPPGRHWEILEAALALIDNESNVFMERFPGTFPLIRLLSLKTQLYVDLERLPEIEDPDVLAERWGDHLSTIDYLLEAYTSLRDQLPDTTT